MYNIHTIIRLSKFMIVNKLPVGYHFDGILICKNCWWAKKLEHTSFIEPDKIRQYYLCENENNKTEFGLQHCEAGLRKTNCKYFNSPKQQNLFSNDEMEKMVIN